MAKKTGKAPKKRTARTAAVSNPSAGTKPRRLKQPKYQSLKLQKRIKHPVRLPNAFRLSNKAAQAVWSHKGLFIGITLVYGLLNLLLVHGLAGSSDLSDLKHTFDQIFTGHFGSLASGLGVFVTLVSSSGNASSDTAGAYQVFLSIIASLAIIWALRQTMAGVNLRIRDAFYKGMYPLVPFILVLLVIGLQFIPLLAGVSLYSIVVNNGIAILGLEKFLWGLFSCLLALLTVYMVSSSIFALYIVTLPDMTPMKALRSARELVRYRRWTIVRKVLFLPVLLLVIAAVIMIPIIIWLTPLAQWVFFGLTMFMLLAVHSYIYVLYRELLNE